MIARTKSGSRGTRQGLLALIMIACALIAWVIWLGQKEARYDEQERVVNAERVEWLQAVSFWTQHPAESMPELLQYLAQDELSGRRSAALALYQIGPGARDWLPEFVSSIDDPDAVVRRYVLLSLTRLGIDLGSWTDQIATRLMDDDPGVRESAARAIAHIGTPAAPAISRALVASKQAPSAILMTVLSHLGTEDPDALARIHQTLSSETSDPKLRFIAFLTLCSIEKLNAHDLEAGLRSGDPDLEHVSLQSISELNLSSPSLLKTFERYLARASGNADPEQIEESLRKIPQDIGINLPISAAWKLGVDPKRLATVLRKRIEDRKKGGASVSEVRLLRALNRDEALLLLPRFLEWERDGTGPGRGWGRSCLKGLGPDAAECLPALIEQVRLPVTRGDSSEWNRWEAIQTIGEIGPAARSAVPSLVEIIARKDTDVIGSGSAAIGALGAVGPAAREAVPTLIEWLKQPPRQTPLESDSFESPQGRALAVDALRRIGLWNAEVADCLDRLRTDEDPVVRRAALVAIAELAPAPVDLLVDALGDTHCLVRRAAASALGRRDGTALEAIPALRRAAEDPENAIPPRIAIFGDEQILVLYGLQWNTWDARVRERTVRECALEAIERIERVKSQE